MAIGLVAQLPKVFTLGPRALSAARGALPAARNLVGRLGGRGGTKLAKAGVNASDDVLRVSDRVKSLEGTRWMHRAFLAGGGLSSIGVYAIAQHELRSGGEVSDATFDAIHAGGVKAAEEFSELDEDAQDAITRSIHSHADKLALLETSLFNKGDLNIAVRVARQNDQENPDAGKNGALKYTLISNAPTLVATNALRNEILSEAYPDLSDTDRQKALAEGMVQDILRKVHCSQLNDNPVQEADIRAYLGQNPEALDKIGNVSRDLKAGFLQIYPELETGSQALGVSEAFDGVKGHRRVDTPNALSAFERTASEGVEQGADVVKDVSKGLDLPPFLSWINTIIAFVTAIPEILARLGNMGKEPQKAMGNLDVPDGLQRVDYRPRPEGHYVPDGPEEDYVPA